jgi:membrane fusion protein, copper/silver efflux system
MRKTLLIAVLFASAIAQEATVRQLFSVQSVKAKTIQTSHSKQSYGYVKADDSRVFDVSPRFGGYVRTLYANKTYQFVKKGEALASVYSPEVYKAKEDYLNSYAYSQGKTHNAMVESSKLRLELLGVSSGEIADVLKNKKVSQNTTIRSPQDGFVFAKNVNEGSAFNAKTKLFEIVNLERVWVEAKVFERDLSWLKNAKSFEASFKSGDKTYAAESTLLYPNLDPKEATFTLRLHLDNKENELFPGMYANVIAKDAPTKYLTLPKSAVIRKNAKFYVFMVGDFEGEYEPVEVLATPLDDYSYVIESGLKNGDEVVSDALFMMDSDAQINGLY